MRDRLLRYIVDVLVEQQIKLGFREEKVRLYCPYESLAGIIGISGDADYTCKCLRGILNELSEQLGHTGISRNGNRICLAISEEGVRYARDNAGDVDFLRDFIDVSSRHGVTLNEIYELFKRYSDCVIYQEESHGEFDVTIYFGDGVPDDYRYCLTKEGEHIT